MSNTQTKPKEIYPDSPEAAELVTIPVWRARTGQVIDATRKDAEETARRIGATHKRCTTEGCTNTMQEHWYKSICRWCDEKQSKDRYDNLPYEELEVDEPIFDEYTEMFFDSADDLLEHYDYIERHPLLSQLRKATPIGYRKLDLEDWDRAFPVDHNDEWIIPEGLKELIDDFNTKLDLIPRKGYKIRYDVRTDLKGYYIGDYKDFEYQLDPDWDGEEQH